MADPDLYNEDDEGTDDGASPASIVDGTHVVNVEDKYNDLPPHDTPGMENVQQLPGEGTTSIDIERPPEADSSGS